MAEDPPSSSNSSASPSVEETASRLTECLFQQYGMTFAGVSCGTAYALMKRPKNGMGIMLVAGAGGSVLDLMYGWNVTCSSQVKDWYRASRIADEAERRRLHAAISNNNDESDGGSASRSE